MKVAKAAAVIDLIVEEEVVVGVETAVVVAVVGAEEAVVVVIRGPVVEEMGDVATKRILDGKMMMAEAVVMEVVAMAEETGDMAGAEVVVMEEAEVEAEAAEVVVGTVERTHWVSMAMKDLIVDWSRNSLNQMTFKAQGSILTSMMISL
jgi:hypothetical protein